ncbi:MAG: polysaccharide pyruvyl transferase family protein [Anaerolineaceae bacterium]|nr:polysaccharide pyruvyl transferase family protein [Anaerolineaceae bacterium]
MKKLAATREARLPQVILWGGWYGSHNVGDQLLLMTIVDLLNAELGELNAFVLTDDPRHVESYMSARGTPVRAIATRKQLLKTIQTIARCDLLILGGGVPFFETPAQLGKFIFLGFWLRVFGKPYFLWSVSSQHIRSRPGRWVIGWFARGAAGATCRDRATYALLESLNVKAVQQTIDSALSFQPPAADPIADAVITRAGKRAADRPLIALTPRTLRGEDNRRGIHYTTQSENAYELELETFSAALDWCWENGYQPIFIPMNTVGADDDRAASREVIQRAKFGQHALLVDEEIRPAQAVNLYAACHASFVARVHGSVTSVIGNCPVVMYAFQPKHTGIMEIFGLSEFSILPDPSAPGAITAQLPALLHQRETIQAQLQTRLARMRADARIPAQIASDFIRAQQRAD